MKILFVCTGNICRSPMAEAMLRHALRERGCAGEIEIASSGTWAYDGSPATAAAVDTMSARGVDAGSHLSRAVDRDELLQADLIVAMTSVHVRELLEVAPEVKPKLVLHKELAEMAPDLEGADHAEERLRRLLAAARPEQRRSLDVDDPMGLPVMAYERCAADLERGISALVDVLCAAP